MATTIKVSVQTRDRLKRQAAAAQMTLGRFVDALSLQVAREERLAALGAAVASPTSADLASYDDEAAAWESTELTDAQ